MKVAIAVSLIKSVSTADKLIEYLREKGLYDDYVQWSSDRLKDSLHNLLLNLDEEEREWIKNEVNRRKKEGKKDA